MKKNKPIGTPVDKEPFALGTWVWHVQTKEGPWVVIEDNGKQLVYVDTKPNQPASHKNNPFRAAKNRHHIAIAHEDVKHYYRCMLTDKEPPKVPHWSTKLDWGKIGVGFGFGVATVLVITITIFIFWSRMA